MRGGYGWNRRRVNATPMDTPARRPVPDSGDSGYVGPMRRLPALLLGLGLAASALATPGLAEASRPEIRTHGARCEPSGCVDPRRSSAASGLGFASVSLATLLLARRRGPASR